MSKDNLKRPWTIAGSTGYYIRKSDLPDPEREAFEKFLRATCRNAPLPDGETAGNTAWWHDYQAFARGEDPYLGMRMMGGYGEAWEIIKEIESTDNPDDQLLDRLAELLLGQTKETQQNFDIRLARAQKILNDLKKKRDR